MTDLDAIKRIVTLLGGWPHHLCDVARGHGLSMMSVLIRDRVIDEAVYAQVCRYALHRAEFDRLSRAISDASLTVKSGKKGFMSGDEQMRAFHENRLVELERQLLATPYARMKSHGTAQTSFMDMLDKERQAQPVGDGSRNVMPLRPISRRTGGA